MSMHNEVSVVNELISDISRAVQGLSTASQALNRAAGGAWEDKQGQAYSSAMSSIATAVGQPVSTLEDAGKRLQQLARILSDYDQINFGS